ncbi:MAG TPA: prefoldin subunit alpha [Methanosarcinaceae archaeon]|nr:prefoldin subunit alpha [Methanosarcinaceae archaeon]
MAEASEQDVRNLAMQHQELQKRAEMTQQQMGAIQMAADDCIRAINAIDELKDAKDGVEMMLPIGSNSYIHAKLNKVDKIVVNVGAGISVEKTMDDAKETLTKRNEQFGKILEQMNASLGQITQNLQAIEAKAAEMQAPAMNTE